MKTTKIILLALISFAFFSCEEEDDTSPQEFAPIQMVFWSDFQGPPIDVYLNDSFVGTITAVGSTPPDCGSSGNATTNVANGSNYQLYAEERQTGRVWETTVTMPQNIECYKFLLHE